MHRLFVAIRPPEEVRETLLDLMEGAWALRWVNDDQLHLTLRFIGEVERPVAEDVAAALDRLSFERFPLALSGVGRFDHRGGGTLWAGVQPKEPLKALAAKVERACQSVGLVPERRAFHPHITLARWKGPPPSQLEAFMTEHGRLRSDPWEANRFILYESRLGRDGPHYEEMAEYALA